MAAGSTTAPAQQPDQHEERLGRLAGDPESGRRTAAGDVVSFTGATYFAQVLVFLAGLLQKGLLGPVGAGYWALMQTAWTYFTIAPLGTMNATSRQIPAYRGLGDYQSAEEVADTGSSFSVLAVAVAGTLVAAVALIFGDSWAPELRYGLVLLGGLAPLRLFADCHKGIFMATKRFDVSSIGVVLEAAIMLVAQTLCVVAFGFYGMFLGIALSILGLWVLWWRLGLVSWRRASFRWRIDRSRIPELLSFGFPLLLQGQLWMLFMSIDNMIVAGFISVRDLGYYALAVSVTNYVLHMPRTLSATLFPRMTEEFIKSGQIESIRRYATETQRVLAYALVPVFLGGAYFLVPVLIRHALPEFAPAIPIVRIMVAASFLIALVAMPTKVLTTAGYRWGITALTVGCLVVNAAANFLAVAVFDWGLEGAAWATAFSYLVAMVTLTTYAMLQIGGPREAAVHVGELLLVFVYVIGAAWAIEWVVGSGAQGLGADILLSSGKLALFLVAITPWVVVAERRYGVVRKPVGMVKRALERRRG